MVSQIKYYRGVLSELIDELPPNDKSIIRLRWTTGKPEKFEQQRRSHKFADEVYLHLLEARMQLGNLLKYVSDDKNPYKEARLKRLSGKDDEIPKETDTDVNFDLPDFDAKVETLDYIRELLEEMNDRLAEKANALDDLDDMRIRIHMNEGINNVSLARNYCGKILGCIKKIREINE